MRDERNLSAFGDSLLVGRLKLNDTPLIFFQKGIALVLPYQHGTAL